MTSYQVWKDEKGLEYLPTCMACGEWLRSSPTYDGSSGVCIRKRCTTALLRTKKDLGDRGAIPPGLIRWCDQCEKPACARWYQPHSAKRERVEYAWCEEHEKRWVKAKAKLWCRKLIASSCRLTEGQKRELHYMMIGPQQTYGAGRARVQNSLVKAGLAKFLEPDGICWCVITGAGRAALKATRTADDSFEQEG